MPRVFPPAMLFALLLSFSGCAAAADNETVAGKRPSAKAQQTGAPDFRSDSSVVLVNVTVTDARGRSIMGLQRENFQIFEEKSKQQVRYFSSEDLPVSVGLVLDFSRSMIHKFSRLQQAVAQFLNIADTSDEFCLIEFRDHADLSLGFTSFPEDIQNRVALARPQGHTALLDAVHLGLQQMKKAHNARTALLIISDGGDNHSRFTAREVENLALESDVAIYTIGISDQDELGLGELESRGPRLLQEISEQCGGEYYGIENPRDLPRVAERIARELRHQYVLGYVSTHPDHDGKFRRVQVKIVRPPGLPKLWANWRRGYYAPVD